MRPCAHRSQVTGHRSQVTGLVCSVAFICIGILATGCNNSDNNSSLAAIPASSTPKCYSQACCCTTAGPLCGCTMTAIDDCPSGAFKYGIHPSDSNPTLSEGPIIDCPAAIQSYRSCGDGWYGPDAQCCGVGGEDGGGISGPGISCALGGNS